MFHFSKKPSQKQIVAVCGAALVLCAVIVVAAIAERHEGSGRDYGRSSHHESRWNRSESDGKSGEYARKSDIVRTVTNTASGADIVLTPTESGALTVLKGEFEVTKGYAAFQNSAFKAEAVESNGSLRVSVTSDLPEVAKLIQWKAASQESGTFGTDLLGESETSSSDEGYSRGSEKRSEGRHGNRRSESRNSEGYDERG